VHNLAKVKNVAFKLYFMSNWDVCNRQKSQAALKEKIWIIPYGPNGDALPAFIFG